MFRVQPVNIAETRARAAVKVIASHILYNFCFNSCSGFISIIFLIKFMCQKERFVKGKMADCTNSSLVSGSEKWIFLRKDNFVNNLYILLR